MKQSINKSQFRDAFRACGREGQFSYEGLGLLFDWLEDFYADASSGEYELDVIALCCDFSEDTVHQVISNYGLDVEGLDIVAKHALVSDFLSENTTLIGETDNESYLYQQF
jgi:hypothetical protein